MWLTVWYRMDKVIYSIWFFLFTSVLRSVDGGLHMWYCVIFRVIIIIIIGLIVSIWLDVPCCGFGGEYKECVLLVAISMVWLGLE